MKKLNIIIVSLILFCSIFTFVGCKNNNTKEQEQPNYNITLNSEIFETTYKLGQSFKMASSNATVSNNNQLVNQSSSNCLNITNNVLLSSQASNDERIALMNLSKYISEQASYTSNSESDDNINGIPIGTYTEGTGKDKETKILYDTDNFEILNFNSTKAGTYTLTIKFGQFEGKIQYTIEDDVVDEVGFVDGNDFYVGENVDNLTLKIVYKSGFVDYVDYKLAHNETIKTDTAKTGNIYLKEYGKTIEYKVHDIKSCSIDENTFLHTFPIGFSYDFSQQETEVEIETTDGLFLRKNVILNGIIDCSTVGDKTITLSNDYLNTNFTYNVLSIIDAKCSDDDTYSVYEDDLCGQIGITVVMENNVEFDMSIDFSTDFDYDEETNIRTYHYDYQGFNFDVKYYMLEDKQIKSISVDDLWNNTYFKGEKYISFINNNSISNYLDDKNEITLGYLTLLEDYNPEWLRNKIEINDEYILFHSNSNNISIKLDISTFYTSFNYGVVWRIYTTLVDYDFFSRLFPINVTYQDNSSETIYVSESHILGLDSFDSNKSKTITLSYDGISFDYTYSISEIDEVDNFDISAKSGESIGDTQNTAIIHYKNNVQKKINANDYLLLETQNKAVFVFGVGKNAKIETINKCKIDEIVEIETYNVFNQYDEVTSLYVKTLTNGITEYVNYSCNIPTNQCGDFSINVYIGGKVKKFDYKVIGVDNIVVNMSKLQLYKDFPDITQIPLIITYTDGSISNVTTYLFTPIKLDSIGTFSKTLNYKINNTTYTIPFNYEVIENPIVQIQTRKSINYILYGQQTNAIQIIISFSNGYYEEDVDIDFDDYLEEGLHTQNVTMYGKTFEVKYCVEKPTTIKFDGRLVYQKDQTISGSLGLTSENASKSIWLNSDMVNAVSTDNNIAITGFDTTTVGTKEMQIKYYGETYCFNYLVGEIESLRITNQNERYYINRENGCHTINLNVKFKGIEEEIASTEYNFCREDLKVGNYSYDFWFNEQKYTFNYVVYDYLSCEIKEIDDLTFTLTNSNLKITSNNIHYLSDDNQSVTIKYVITTTDAQTMSFTESVELLDNSIGVHKQKLQLKNKFEYTLEYEVKTPKSVEIIPDYHFRQDDVYYVIKDFVSDFYLKVKICQDDDKNTYEYIDFDISNLQAGTISGQLNIFGQNFDYSFELLELKNITTSVENELYANCINELKIKLTIETKQDITFECYVETNIGKKTAGTYTYYFDYYNQQLSVDYTIQTSDIESIEIVDNSIPLVYEIDSTDEVLSSGWKIKINYQDDTSETFECYKNNGSYNFRKVNDNQELSVIYVIGDSNLDYELIISWQGRNTLGTFNLSITYKGFTQTFEYQVVPFVLSGTKITGLKDCGKTLSYIEIPDGITEIANCAFTDCSNIECVYIPNSVISIGDNAFYNCTNLQNITLPNGITNIGSYAFYNCSNLQNITIPSSVSNIGDNAFYGCSSLNIITIPNSVTSIGYNAFYGCSSLGNVYYEGTIKAWCNIVFNNENSNSLKNIYNFYVKDSNENYQEVREISITEIDKINSYAFYGFNGLTKIETNGALTIGDYSFANCSNITNANFRHINTNFGIGSFLN